MEGGKRDRAYEQGKIKECTFVGSDEYFQITFTAHIMDMEAGVLHTTNVRAIFNSDANTM